MTVDNFIFGLLGTFLGGLLTWIITKDSLKKQFQYQKELLLEESRKNELIAMNSVRREIQHNIIKLNHVKKIMVSEKIEFINFKGGNQNNSLKNNKWEKHSDIIEYVTPDDLFSKIQAFYINISAEIDNQVNNMDRTEKLISQGLDCIKLLEIFIEEY